MFTNVKTLIVGVAVVIGWATPAWTAEVYDIDPAHSTVVFAVNHLGASVYRGLFRTVSGELTFDEKNPAQSSVMITIDTASVFTGNKKRDEHIKSPDFLNAKQFPKISFESTKVRKAGKTYHVTGKLSLHGVTKTIKVKFKQVGEGKDPWGKYRSGFDGSFSIKRSDYGMSKMIGPAGDKITLLVAVEGIKQ